jgi:hypothetical protein
MKQVHGFMRRNSGFSEGHKNGKVLLIKEWKSNRAG